MTKKKRAKGTGIKVDPKLQETCMIWYRNAKVIDIYTTNYSDICLLKRRGWEETTGKEAKDARPYLIFRIPRKSITIRSKPKARKK